MKPTYKDVKAAINHLKDINKLGKSGGAVTSQQKLKNKSVAEEFANDIVNIRNKIFHNLKEVNFGQLEGVFKSIKDIHKNYGDDVVSLLDENDKVKHKTAYNKAYSDLTHLFTRVTQYLDNKGNIKSEKIPALLGFIKGVDDTPDKDLIKFLIEKKAPQMGGLPLKAMMIGDNYKIAGMDVLEYCKQNKIDLSFKDVDFSRTLHTNAIAGNLIKSGVLTDKSLTQLLLNRKTTVIDEKSLPKEVSESQFTIMLKSGKLSDKAISQLIERDNLDKHFESNPADIKYLTNDQVNHLVKEECIDMKLAKAIFSDNKFKNFKIEPGALTRNPSTQTAQGLISVNALTDEAFDNVLKSNEITPETLFFNTSDQLPKGLPQYQIDGLVEKGFVTVECLAELAESGRYSKEKGVTLKLWNEMLKRDEVYASNDLIALFKNNLISDELLKQEINAFKGVKFEDLPKNLSMAQAQILFENNALEAPVLIKVIDKLEKAGVDIQFKNLPKDLKFDQVEVLVKRGALNLYISNEYMKDNYSILADNAAKIDSEMLKLLVSQGFLAGRELDKLLGEKNLKIQSAIDALSTLTEKTSYQIPNDLPKIASLYSKDGIEAMLKAGKISIEQVAKLAVENKDFPFDALNADVTIGKTTFNKGTKMTVLDAIAKESDINIIRGIEGQLKDAGVEGKLNEAVLAYSAMLEGKGTGVDFNKYCNMLNGKEVDELIKTGFIEKNIKDINVKGLELVDGTSLEKHLLNSRARATDTKHKVTDVMIESKDKLQVTELDKSLPDRYNIKVLKHDVYKGADISTVMGKLLKYDAKHKTPNEILSYVDISSLLKSNQIDLTKAETKQLFAKPKGFGEAEKQQQEVEKLSKELESIEKLIKSNEQEKINLFQETLAIKDKIKSAKESNVSQEIINELEANLTLLENTKKEKDKELLSYWSKEDVLKNKIKTAEKRLISFKEQQENQWSKNEKALLESPDFLIDGKPAILSLESVVPNIINYQINNAMFETLKQPRQQNIDSKTGKVLSKNEKPVGKRVAIDEYLYLNNSRLKGAKAFDTLMKNEFLQNNTILNNVADSDIIKTEDIISHVTSENKEKISAILTKRIQHKSNDQTVDKLVSAYNNERNPDKKKLLKGVFDICQRNVLEKHPAGFIRSGLLEKRHLKTALDNATEIKGEDLPQKLDLKTAQQILDSGKMTPEAVSKLCDQLGKDKLVVNKDNVGKLRGDQLGMLITKEVLSLPQVLELATREKDFPFEALNAEVIVGGNRLFSGRKMSVMKAIVTQQEDVGVLIAQCKNNGCGEKELGALIHEAGVQNKLSAYDFDQNAHLLDTTQIDELIKSGFIEKNIKTINVKGIKIKDGVSLEEHLLKSKAISPVSKQRIHHVMVGKDVTLSEQEFLDGLDIASDDVELPDRYNIKLHKHGKGEKASVETVLKSMLHYDDKNKMPNEILLYFNAEDILFEAQESKLNLTKAEAKQLFTRPKDLGINKDDIGFDEGSPMKDMKVINQWKKNEKALLESPDFLIDGKPAALVLNDMPEIAPNFSVLHYQLKENGTKMLVDRKTGELSEKGKENAVSLIEYVYINKVTVNSQTPMKPLEFVGGELGDSKDIITHIASSPEIKTRDLVELITKENGATIGDILVERIEGIKSGEITGHELTNVMAELVVAYRNEKSENVKKEIQDVFEKCQSEMLKEGQEIGEQYVTSLKNQVTEMHKHPFKSQALSDKDKKITSQSGSDKSDVLNVSDVATLMLASLDIDFLSKNIRAFKPTGIKKEARGAEKFVEALFDMARAIVQFFAREKSEGKVKVEGEEHLSNIDTDLFDDDIGSSKEGVKKEQETISIDRVLLVDELGSLDEKAVDSVENELEDQEKEKGEVMQK